MSKAERAAALTQRRNAVTIIKNLRFTRRFLASHPFDEATYQYIDGKARPRKDTCDLWITDYELVV